MITSLLSIRFCMMIVLALVLTVMPWPTLLIDCRPPWLLLVLLYLQFWQPSYFRIPWVFLIGLGLDALQLSVMGEHTFALLLTCWFAANIARRFHFFSTIQQMLFVLIFCLIYQSVLYLIDASLGYNDGILFMLGSTLAGMLVWPWVKMLAEYIKIGVYHS